MHTSPNAKILRTFLQKFKIATFIFNKFLIVESRGIETPIYPYKDIQKMAKINEALEFIAEGQRATTLRGFAKTFVIPVVFKGPKLTEAGHKNIQEEVTESYGMTDDWLKLAGGKYMANEELSIADFYMFIWIMFLKEGIKKPISDHPNLDKWYTSMLEVKEVKKYTNKFKKMLKMATMMMTCMFPCMRICCCCY